MYTGSYRNGKRDGKWTEKAENGTVTFEGTYRNGEKDGVCTEIDAQGVKKTITYRDGAVIR